MDLIGAPIRIARPTADLAAAERFWCDGAGLDPLYRGEAHGPGEHDLLIVGATGAQWHLELVADPVAHRAARPSVEDLLVVYLGDEQEVALSADRLLQHGGVRVIAANPYWERWGVTVVDPDGYRLVLSHRTWAAAT